MGKMKEVVDRILDLVQNDYDDEAIALIVGVDITIVEQVKRNSGLYEEPKDIIEKY